ncbi:hypothetical protein Pcinc_043874 [Petrolisthes cinctipes]|uniref:Uncharacterized protein n=1 Tax=Petrolisthes cinctipes TaxID=88211 RepID=A0AAE1EFS6_PETCI|nr:hypothetical protein Pcinc_043874 [Petrolisthes cinctipes]
MRGTEVGGGGEGNDIGGGWEDDDGGEGEGDPPQLEPVEDMRPNNLASVSSPASIAALHLLPLISQSTGIGEGEATGLHGRCRKEEEEEEYTEEGIGKSEEERQRRGEEGMHRRGYREVKRRRKRNTEKRV